MEAAGREAEKLEFETRGGPWEGFHALVFYAAVTCAVLATVGLARMATGIAAVTLLFYSILAIFSSPTYVVILPGEKAVVWESYRFFVPFRRKLRREDLAGVEVVESSHVPTGEGSSASKRDLSYFVRVYLKPLSGRKRKVFRSGMTGLPVENRAKAFLVAESLAGHLDLPVTYTRLGGGK